MFKIILCVIFSKNRKTGFCHSINTSSCWVTLWHSTLCRFMFALQIAFVRIDVCGNIRSLKHRSHFLNHIHCKSIWPIGSNTYTKWCQWICVPPREWSSLINVQFMGNMTANDITWGEGWCPHWLDQSLVTSWLQ